MFYKALVSGHVDDAYENVGVQRQRREPQLDGDAARFFLFEAVGVAAGEAFDEDGFAVVDVAGGAEGDVGLGCGHGGVRHRLGGRG